MILVDTSVLIDFFRGRDNAACRKFKTILDQKIPYGITSLIFQEILQGAKTEKEFALLKDYLEVQIFYHPKDAVDAALHAARLYFDCRKKGITVRSTADCLIATIALENGLLLLHNDSDFAAMQKVAKLRFY